MSYPDPPNTRGRALEEEYFRKRDQELVEKLRQAAEAVEARKALGATTGINDPAILSDLQELGFTPDTIGLLPILPVLQVAWAEGGISARERTLILELASSRGVAEGTRAHNRLLEWLSTPPAPEVLARATRLIAVLLSASGHADAELKVAELVAYCEKVAGASGGVFGLGRVSAEEKEIISSIARDLQGRS